MANLTPADSYDDVYQVAPTDKVSDTVFNKVIQALLNRTFWLQKRMPPGMIVMWSGAANNIPAHWHLCDGSNGTPNLQGRFVVGAGGGYGVGEHGGSADAVLVAHTHTALSGGIHNHTGKDYQYLLKPPYDGSLTGSDTVNSGSEQAVGIGDGGTMSDAGEHTHTINSAGSGNGVNANLPPYYALCYIMLMS